MAAEIIPITESNREDMESLLSTVAEIAERTRRMEADLHALAVAFSTGGARGLRTLARSFADRPDPDGSRAQFLADGLDNLQNMGKPDD